MSALKALASAFAGLVTAVVVILLLEMIGHAIYPMPAGMHDATPEQLGPIMKSMPQGALVLVVLGWAVGVFAGALVAGLLSRALRPPLVVGIVILAATVAMFFYVPHPAWVMAAGVALPLPLAYAAAKIAMRKRPA